MQNFVRWIEDTSLYIASVLVVFVMVVVSFDGASRYIFHRPLPWSFEVITYYLLGAILYLAVSSTFRHGDHISIDLFRGMMPAPLRRGLDIVWGILSAGVFALIAYGVTREMMSTYAHGEFFPGYFVWPVWVAYLSIAVGAATTTLRLLLHCFELVAHGEDKFVATSGEHHE